VYEGRASRVSRRSSDNALDRSDRTGVIVVLSNPAIKTEKQMRHIPRTDGRTIFFDTPINRRRSRRLARRPSDGAACVTYVCAHCCLLKELILDLSDEVFMQ